MVRYFIMRYTLLSLIFLIILSTACGYRFSGGGALPGGVSTIGIEILKNRTAETGLETTMTDDLLFEFTRAALVKVVSVESADAVLSGTIQRLVTSPIAYTGTSTTTQQRAILTVDLVLISAADGNVMWEQKGITDEEAFDVGSSKTATSANLQSALEILSQKMAERIFLLITADF